MKKIIFSLLLFPTISFAYEIEGAFGLKFNSQQDIKDEQYKKIKFVPEEGYEFSMFKEYSYSVTPKTKKIYSISAEGDVLTNCNKDLGIINKIIEDKYKIKSYKRDMPIKFKIKEVDFNDNITTYSFKDEKNRILLSCDPEYKKIAITYVDTETAKKSFEESEAILNKDISKEIKKMKKEDLYKVKGL